MRIYQVKIKNFRGVKSLQWDVSEEIACLVGPSDSTKTTILEAIKWALYPNWQITIQETDFYDCDTGEEIIIELTIGSLPEYFWGEKFAGLSLRGWNSTDGLKDDPEDGDEKVITIQLRIDDSFEPEWVLVKENSVEPRKIRHKERMRLGMAWLDSYVDRDLSLSKGSALQRLQGDIGSTTKLLNDIKKTAKENFASKQVSSTNPFVGLKDKITTCAKTFGVCPKKNFCFDLDGKRDGNITGTVSVFDGTTPARLMGLGSRRLLSLAIQNAKTVEGGIVLIDEIEHGLEPHRVRHLIRSLRPKPTEDNTVGQVFMTTHSSVAVTELKAREINTVHSENGIVKISKVDDSLQAIVRSNPEAFLGKLLIVCEGKTEMGICRALDKYWETNGKEPLAYKAIATVDGGGDSAINRAKKMRELGYSVIVVKDSDVNETSAEEETALNESGIKLVEWADKSNVEVRTCRDIPLEGLQEIIDLACNILGEDCIFDSLHNKLPNLSREIFAKEVTDWPGDLETDEASVRVVIGGVAHGKDWFKRTDKGEDLGNIVVKYLSQISNSDLAKKIKKLETLIYGGE